MTDPHLTELLEAAGDRIHVGPSPVAEIVAGARRRRRRMMLVTAGAAAAVVLTVGAATILTAPGVDSLYPVGPVGNPSTAPSSKAKPAPTGRLEGTWIVDDLVGAGGQSVLPDNQRGDVVLTFADGELTGTTGCNTVFGTYQHGGEDGRDLRFPHEELGSTLVGCADEPPLITRLLDVRHVSGSGNVRRLHAENWMIIAELRRARDSGAAPRSDGPGVDGVRVVINSHCGVRSVWVEGRLWLASPPLGGHNPPPGWGENETPGVFEVTAQGRALFHGEDGQSAPFRLAEPGTPDPNEGCE